jgi:hypothetical protein
MQPLPAATTSCDDSSLAPGTYEYRVTAVFGSWTSASALSGPAVIFALDHFTVVTPNTNTAGAPFDVSVTARDAGNNIITNYRGTVHFTTGDSQATLPADYTFISSDNGSHTFVGTTILRTSGTQVLSASDTSNPSASGTATLTITAAALDHFTVNAPAVVTAGTAFSGTGVTAQDAFGNAAAGWRSTTRCVSFGGAINAPDGTAPIYPDRATCALGESQLTFNASGLAMNFSMTLFAAAPTRLTVTAGASIGQSATINVSAATATELILTGALNRNGPVTLTCTGPPTSVICTTSSTNGSGNHRFISATVSIVDAYRNLTTNSSAASLSITVSQTGGTTIAPTLLTIPVGAATSPASFTAVLQNGSASITVVASGNVGASAVQCALTTM